MQTFMRRSTGQTLVLFALVLPVAIGMIGLVATLGIVYANQQTNDATVRAVALTAMRTVASTQGPTDTLITADITHMAQANGFSSIRYTQSQSAPAPNVVAITGVYSPSLGIVGSGLGLSLSGTQAVAITLTTSLHLYWPLGGAPTVALHSTATATLCAGYVILAAHC